MSFTYLLFRLIIEYILSLYTHILDIDLLIILNIGILLIIYVHINLNIINKKYYKIYKNNIKCNKI